MLPVPACSLRVPVELSTLPFNDKSSTSNSSNFLFPSTIKARDAVNVPAVAPSRSVKYLPPIATTLAAAPAVSTPVPIYNLSPPLALVPTPIEYPSSPVASVGVEVLVRPRLIFKIAAIFMSF